MRHPRATDIPTATGTGCVPWAFGIRGVRMMAGRASFARGGRIVFSSLQSTSAKEEPTAHNPCRGYQLIRFARRLISIGRDPKWGTFVSLWAEGWSERHRGLLGGEFLRLGL